MFSFDHPYLLTNWEKHILKKKKLDLPGSFSQSKGEDILRGSFIASSVVAETNKSFWM